MSRRHATPHRLIHRIRALFALVFLISVVGNALYTAHEQSAEILDQLEQNALAETRVIRAILTPEIAGSQDPLSALRMQPPSGNGMSGVAIVALDGRVISAMVRGKNGDWEATSSARIDTVPTHLFASTRTVDLPGSESPTAIVSWVPVATTGTAVWLRTETGTAAAQDVWRHILTDSLLHGLIALLIAIAALHVLLRRPLATLHQCTEFAERLDRSMGETLSTKTGSHETDRLAEALNWASLNLYDQRSALAESEARTGAIMNAALDAVITFDGFGNVIEYNPAAERMLGWTTAEAMQRPVIELLVASDERKENPTDLLKWLSQRFEAVIGHHLELDITHRDGHRFPAELAITSTQMKGRALFTAFVSDISERKAVQEQMMHARDAAEAANRAKSDFLANMSHEIRTPMNAIMGMTELALDTDLSAEQREYLSLVKQSSETLLTLIDEILDFSKIEAGRLDFEHVPFSLREVVGSTLRTLAPRPNAQVQLTCDIDTSVADGIIGDPTRLRQVLTNLLANALKFTERGSIELSIAQEDLCPESQTLRFAIRDTGIGIPKDKQALIFDAFSQADTSTTRKFGGTGLGLTICRRLVERMGGTIGVVSHPGLGSTFHFTARFQRADPGALTSLATDELEGLSVMVIEPSEPSRKQIERQLAQWRVSPKVCATLDEGVDALASACSAGQGFHALIVDAALTTRDDWNVVCALIVQREPRLSVIILSDGEYRPDETCPEGISSVIGRPVEPLCLFDALMIAARPHGSGRQHKTSQSPRSGAQPNCMHILLAEDNPVNQTLAVRMLERLGHQVDVAANGLEALSMAAGRRFDLILMDIQMPHMSGFEATQQIRINEAPHHTPIIAMTAHAMAGDREKCLDAGMDGYISKPIRVAALLRALEEAAGVTAANDAPPAGTGTSGGPRFDRAFVLGNLNADVRLMHEIIRIFLRDCRKGVDALRHALISGSPEEVSSQAHMLKGMVSNFGATRTASVAAQLERHHFAADASGPDAATLMDLLEDEIEALSAELRAELQDVREVA